MLGFLFSPLRNLFKLIGKYLENDTVESLMRLLSLIAVITGCLFIVGIIFYIIYNLVTGNAADIDLLGVAACVGSGATFVGTGIAGKAYQKKIEYSTFQYKYQDEIENRFFNRQNQLMNNQQEEYGEGDTEGIPLDEQL